MVYYKGKKLSRESFFHRHMNKQKDKVLRKVKLLNDLQVHRFFNMKMCKFVGKIKSVFRDIDLRY